MPALLLSVRLNALTYLFDYHAQRVLPGFDTNVNRVEILRSNFPLYPASEMNWIIKQEKIEELFVQYHKEINFEISELNLFSITFKQNFKKAFVDKSSLSKIISTSDISNDVFAGMEVLIVEDDKLSRDIAVELLGELKIKCDIACDGIEALEKITIKKNRYDIILMDIQMPRMDGYKTTKKIRILKDKDISKVPIIAMTANVLDTDKQKAYECGMNGYIPKPIVIDRIKNEFVKVLQQ